MHGAGKQLGGDVETTVGLHAGMQRRRLLSGHRLSLCSGRKSQSSYIVLHLKCNVHGVCIEQCYSLSEDIGMSSIDTIHTVFCVQHQNFYWQSFTVC